MNIFKCKFSLVIPCYNEARNLPSLMARLDSLYSARGDVQIVLVENGSRDESLEFLRKQAASRHFLKIVRFDENQGYGGGILGGLMAASGEYLGWTHADLQTDPADVLKAADIIEKMGNPANIYVKGERSGRPFSDAALSFGMGVFETLLLGERLFDINAQPNVFHRSFFEKWKCPPRDFSLDLYAFYMARRAGLNVVRIGVSFPGRVHGCSKWNLGLASRLKFIKRTIEYSFKLKRRLGDAIHSSQD